MQWINSSHILNGVTPDLSHAPRGNMSNRPSDSTFADILAARINEASRISGNGEALSPETVKLLTMILTRHLDDAFGAGMASWLNNKAIPSHLTSLPRSQPAPALSPSPTPATPQASQPASPQSDLSSLIDKAASRYKLDPALISSVIETESSFNPKAVSDAGAQGLMQLMPETARELNVTDPFDPAQNIDGGSRYLSRLMKRYHGDTKLALAAYNWGMGNLEKQPDKMPSETKNYVINVMKRWNEKRTAVA